MVIPQRIRWQPFKHIDERSWPLALSPSLTSIAQDKRHQFKSDWIKTAICWRSTSCHSICLYFVRIERIFYGLWCTSTANCLHFVLCTLDLLPRSALARCATETALQMKSMFHLVSLQFDALSRLLNDRAIKNYIVIAIHQAIVHTSITLLAYSYS